MITLRQDASDDYAFGRISVRNTVSPARDTGFRAEPSEPFVYVAREKGERNRANYEYVHNDDVKVVGKPRRTQLGEAYSYITGQYEPYGGHPSTALNAVNTVTVNQESHNAREQKYLTDRIARIERTRKTVDTVDTTVL
jgi:hypothetical protein